MIATPPLPADSARDSAAPGSDRRVVLLSAEAEQTWAEEVPASSIVRTGPGEGSDARPWLDAALATSATRQHCAVWAAARLGCEAGALTQVSESLRPVFAARLLATAGGTAGAAERFCAAALGWTGAVLADDLAHWTAFAEIVPAAELPRWIICAGADLPAALELGDALAQAGIPVGLRVESAAWGQWLGADCWGRAAARWRLVPVLGGGFPKADEPRGAAHLLRDRATAASAHFVRRAAPGAAALLDRAAKLIAVEKAGAAPASGEARSAAEALLFAVLDARPFTHGRFRLNLPLGFSFGLRAAEGDLVAAAARLVVEIDGYYHFRDADGYRRDRRKDTLLQQHGWFVQRFLAEDVVLDLERVVRDIEETLARRDASQPATAVP